MSPSLCTQLPQHEALSDDVLVGCVRDRCEDGLAVLYGRYATRCFALAQRLVRDNHRAEDVLQDVFIGLWRNCERYDPRRGTLLTWLLTITHHRSVDALRRERRHPPGSVDEVLRQLPAQGPSVDDQLIATIDAEHVRVALGSLRAESRHAIELAYFGGYSQSEIAAMTGTPLGTVKSRMRLAMSTLKTSLRQVSAIPAQA
jgi:RNA polymerase sigma factor (sigma-70 family)